MVKGTSGPLRPLVCSTKYCWTTAYWAELSLSGMFLQEEKVEISLTIPALSISVPMKIDGGGP